jgi:MFS family permease
MLEHILGFLASIITKKCLRALYLIGFGVGPLFAGPLSEAFGRNPVYTFTFLGFILFQLGPALGQNAQTVFICRFFSGFFGSTPLSNAGGSVNDMFNPLDRTLSFPIFAAMPFVGPAVYTFVILSNRKPLTIS